MRLEKSWFYNFCIALSIIGMTYIIVCGLADIGDNQEYPYALKGALLLGLFLAWMGVQLVALLKARFPISLPFLKQKRVSIALEAGFVIIVLAAAAVVRLLIVKNIPMAPASDYKTFYEVAELLKKGTLQQDGEGYCNYIAMFPHVMGYSFLLKLIFTWFGTSVFAGQCANIVLSTATVFLVYRIARKLGGRPAGILAILLGAFWPSQILYITTLSSEYAFTFFLYLAILLFVHLVQDYHGGTEKPVIPILLHILLGGIIAVTAAIRPMALILLIAIVLCLLPQKMKLPNIPRNDMSLWLRLLEKGWMRCVLIIIPYMIVSNIITTDIEMTINQSVPSASVSFGYNLLVGLNLNSYGGWNEEDSKFLYDNLDSTGSAIQAQIASRDLAFVRLQEDPKALLNLFIKKYEVLWGNDDYGATWNLILLQDQEHLTTPISNFLYTVRDYNNVLYISTVFFSIIALIYLWKKKGSYAYLLTLLYLGTVAMHLLVENQNRYHFHALQIFVILAAVGVGYIFEDEEEYVLQQLGQKKEIKQIKEMEKMHLKSLTELEQQVVEERHRLMTNTFDMKSALEKGNIIMTVSAAYQEEVNRAEALEDVAASLTVEEVPQSELTPMAEPELAEQPMAEIAETSTEENKVQAEAEISETEAGISETETELPEIEEEVAETETELLETEAEVIDTETKLPEIKAEVIESETKLPELEAVEIETGTKLSKVEVLISEIETKLPETEKEVAEIETELPKTEASRAVASEANMVNLQEIGSRRVPSVEENNYEKVRQQLLREREYLLQKKKVLDEKMLDHLRIEYKEK